MLIISDEGWAKEVIKDKNKTVVRYIDMDGLKKIFEDRNFEFDVPDNCCHVSCGTTFDVFYYKFKPSDIEVVWEEVTYKLSIPEKIWAIPRNKEGRMLNSYVRLIDGDNEVIRYPMPNIESPKGWVCWGDELHIALKYKDIGRLDKFFHTLKANNHQMPTDSTEQYESYLKKAHNKPFNLKLYNTYINASRRTMKQWMKDVKEYSSNRGF